MVVPRRSRTRYAPAAIVFAIGMLTAAGLFLVIGDWRTNEVRVSFDRVANERIAAFRRHFDASLEALRAVRSFQTASFAATREEFRQFIAPELEYHADIQAIQWAPRVEASQRTDYEAFARSEGYPDYAFTERAADGTVVPAGARDAYYPLHYVEPMAGNESALGFDLGSDATRRRALERARDTGMMVATPRLNLVQEIGRQYGCLIFLPVYLREVPTDTVAERRAYLRGFAVGTFKIGDIVQRALASTGFDVFVFDRSAGAGGQALYPYRPDLVPTDLAGNRFSISATIDVGGRDWLVVVRASGQGFEDPFAWLPWVVLAAGALFSLVLAAYVQAILNRRDAVEQTVLERTAELSEAKERAEAGSRAKTEFLSTVSHELRTPLTSIKGSLGLIRSGTVGTLPEKLQAMLEIAYNNSDRLIHIINDILDVEKIEAGAMEFQMRPLEVMPLIEQSMAANKGFADEHRVAFVITEALPGAWIESDGERLLQVMANLLSNAAKYSSAGDTVEIGVARDDDLIRVSVSDNGPGIPAQFHDRIFDKFSQADSSDSREKGGTGLGLSISKAIIERHGGEIDFDSDDGAGTTFYFTLPEWWDAGAAAGG